MGFGRRMTNNETWLFFVGLTGRSRHCRRSSEWRLAEKVIINNVERISLLSLAACSYTNALFASLLSLHRLGTLYRCTHCNILHLNTTQHRMCYAPTSTGSTLQQRLRSSPVNALSLRHHLSKKNDLHRFLVLSLKNFDYSKVHSLTALCSSNSLSSFTKIVRQRRKVLLAQLWCMHDKGSECWRSTVSLWYSSMLRTSAHGEGTPPLHYCPRRRHSSIALVL